jgi:hypothetical protein
LLNTHTTWIEEAASLLSSSDWTDIVHGGREVPQPRFLEWCGAWQLGLSSAALRSATHPRLTVRKSERING